MLRHDRSETNDLSRPPEEAERAALYHLKGQGFKAIRVHVARANSSRAFLSKNKHACWIF